MTLIGDPEREMRESAKQALKQPRRKAPWEEYREPDPRLIKESFRWVTPEFKRLDGYGPKTIKIKGVALTANTVSKNNRLYIDEELRRAARTLRGKPINVNHNPKQIIGHVEVAEYEDGNLEFIGVIKKQPYVDMLRENDPRIRGLSVEGEYFYMRCLRCGEKFYTEEEFQKHMAEVHHVHNGVGEVHGLHLQGLSLVLAPELPGVETTEIELLEMAEAQNRIYEIILMEKAEMRKVEIPFKEQGEKPPKDWWDKCVATVKAGMPEYSDEQVAAVCGYIWYHKPEQHGIGESVGLTEKVEKRGDKWCVVHCTGPDAGEVIKCFDTKEEAEAMHRAIMANKNQETARALEKLEKRVTQIEEGYKTIVEAAEKELAQLKETPNLATEIEALKQRIEALEKNNGILKETENLVSRLEKLETKQANLEAKFYKLSVFKGHAPPMNPQHIDKTVIGDPEKELRESAKKRKKK